LGWTPSMPFDFTRIFSGAEPAWKYACGRRMRMAYTILADAPGISPTYEELVSSAPYPATMPVRKSKKISHLDLMAVMRNRYQGTDFDMTKGVLGLSGGPFGTPDRWRPNPNSQVAGNWERTIAIFRTQFSHVLVARSWLPREIGGTVWYASHAAHTSVYIPFPSGIHTNHFPVSFTNNSFMDPQRGRGVWQASRFVFNIAQLRFNEMIIDIQNQQNMLESRSTALQEKLTREYLEDRDLTKLSIAYAENAVEVVKKWWELSDLLMLHYADGFCNDCGRPVRNLGYPDWWPTV